MGDSAVFVVTLKLFRFESEVIAKKGSDLEWDNANIEKSTELIQEIYSSFDVASFPDQLKVSLHIFTALNRFINRCFSPVTLKVLHLKLLLPCSNLQEKILSVLWLKVANQSKVYSMLCNQNVAMPMVLQVVTLFEVIKENLAAQSNESFLANEEHLSLTYLKIFLNLLEICFYEPKDLNSDNESGNMKQNFLSKVKGPVLAQTIQSLLHFAKSKSKTVASTSLQCLLTLLTEISVCTKLTRMEFGPGVSTSTEKMTELMKSLVADFRNFFPGIFSSLYALCSSGYKR